MTEEKIPLISMFLAKSGGLSSKRICGIFGYFICLGLLVAAFVLEKKVPDFADMLLITSTSLLGVDAFKGIFSRNLSN